jgi:hypothetical protein
MILFSEIGLCDGMSSSARFVLNAERKAKLLPLPLPRTGP